MKNGQIFFKFSQELYYMMLKQISVTVCHNLWPSHYSKILSKWFHQFRSVCGQPPSYSFYCIELNHQIALHGNIIAHFELWTEHSEYLKKWSALSFPDLSGKSNNRKFRNVVIRNGNTEKAQNYEMFVQFPYAWSYECHPRKL